MSPTDLTRIQRAIELAREVTASEHDAELRKTAFAVVLEHMLRSGTPSRHELVSNDTGRAPHPPDKGQVRKKAGGPKSKLEELLAEGFFSSPRSSQEVLQALAERGHHLKHPDLTWPLQQLLREKRLRRKHAESEGRRVWAYSNW